MPAKTLKFRSTGRGSFVLEATLPYSHTDRVGPEYAERLVNRLRGVGGHVWGSSRGNGHFVSQKK